MLIKRPNCIVRSRAGTIAQRRLAVSTAAVGRRTCPRKMLTVATYTGQLVGWRFAAAGAPPGGAAGGGAGKKREREEAPAASSA